MYSFTNARYYGFLDSSAAERVGVFGKALNYIKSYPLFGGGIGAAGGILDSQFARAIIETGLIGLVLFIWLLIGLFRIGIRLFRRGNEGWIKGFSIGFIIVVIGLIAHSFGNVTFYIVRIAEPFWALTGIVAYLLVTAEANSGKVR
jgi:O-antigen ligase